MSTEEKRPFSSLFTKLSPDSRGESFLQKAGDYTTRKAKNEDGRLLFEFNVDMTEVFPKEVIYRLESEIAEAYNCASVRIFPHYSAELFTEDYIPEILIEAKRIGVVANGFFNDAVCSVEGDNIKVAVPFGHGGIELLDLARTADVLSSIVRSEFGIERTFTITEREDYAEFEEQFRREQEEYIRQENERAAKEYEAYREMQKKQADAEKKAEDAKKSEAEKERIVYPKVASIFEGSDEIERLDEFTIRSGKMTFDVSEPKTVSGDIFTFENVKPIRALVSLHKNIVVIGQVFEINEREIKRTNKVALSVGVTDKDSSVFVKVTMDPEASAEFLDIIKKGKYYAFHGDVKKDKYDGENYIEYTDIAEVKRILRKDKAEDKRVELHLHTTLSAMDATIKPEEAVDTAARFGHKAVAITDHGNLQAFPLAMLEQEKLKKNGTDIKVIYGMEAYFVDDTARAIFGESDNSFRDEFVFFDIETTGLSVLNCEITEIGAVRCKDGEVLEEFNMLVNPGIHIPEDITELTGISDETVKDAPPISEVLPKFFDFIGDSVLVAHNASFDTGFIAKAAEKLGLPFRNPFLDTVAMSRHINPDLQKHKLDVLAKYFKLGDFNHHRASDDAKMLAAIFYKMTDKLVDEGIYDLDGLTTAMSEKADPLKLRTYHQIILVKNKTGLKNLYRLVSDSYLTYYRRFPRIPKTRLQENREGLIIGSACEAGELFRAILDNKPEAEIENIAKFYDYLEIQPISNNSFMLKNGMVNDEEGLRDLNRRIVALGHKLGIPVCATCDAHYLDDDDFVYRSIILAGMKFSDYDHDSHLYFRTTDEMLDEFAYLGEETAREVVIDNPNMIAEMIDTVRPIPNGNFPPHIEGSEEELTTKCHQLAKEWYGDPLPEVVSARLEKELGSIIKNGFAIMYIIARKLVENSEEKGYQVGSRGSVGSSFAATMAGITKVNPLPPHYRCPKCKWTQFFTNGEVGSGFDLPDKTCPECGERLIRDGHDIPFETFLGFYGDKTPDIDLNFSGDVQGDAHKFTEVLFGTGKAFKAGTLGTLADKTAYGYVMKYLDERHVSVNRAEADRMVWGIAGIKRTTGQHPGGIIVVPAEYDICDFSPIQHPADDPNSDIVTTHFAFTYLHDTILKLDILGHDIPTKYKRLEEFTNTNILEVPLSDPKVYRLFTSTEPLGVKPEDLYECQNGTLGLPEMGTRLVRGVLMDAQPKNFADLLQISGLTHGTGCWAGNADELIKSGTCTISEVIGCRDDIMMTLIHKYGLEKGLAFKIMEFVRKNKKGLVIPQEMQDAMHANNVPQWYIDSLQKIRYMFPKAHAAAYVIDALRIGYYKIYYPCEFYGAYFTAAPDGFEAQMVMGGKDAVRHEIERLEKMKKDGVELTQKDNGNLNVLQIVLEYYARGMKFLPVDLKKSHAYKFLPENGSIRLPFASLAGLGTEAAAKIMDACRNNDIISVEQLKREAKVPQKILDMLAEQGALDGLNETSQMTMFQTSFSHSDKQTDEAAPKSAKEKPAKADKPAGEDQLSMF